MKLSWKAFTTLLLSSSYPITTTTTLFLISSSSYVLGYVSSGLPQHVHCAWLSKMTSDVIQSPIGCLPPDLYTATPDLLSAWSQNPFIPYSQQLLFLQNETDDYPHHGRECAQMCELLLRRWVEEKKANKEYIEGPTTVAYNRILHIWKRSGEKAAAAQRMEEILIGMQDAYMAGQKEVQPDYESFRSVILAWAQIHNKDEFSAHRAHRVLVWMLHLYQSGINDKACPDTDLFNSVLHAWAVSHHEDSPYKTEEILLLMDKLHREDGITSIQPNLFSFNQVLTAWSKSGSNISATRAQDVLDYMETYSQQPNHEWLQPNIVSYAAVATAWGRRSGMSTTISRSNDGAEDVEEEDSATRAEDILKRVEKKFLSSHQDPRPCPDTILYNFVIEAHAKSNTPDSFWRARKVLDRQMALYKGGVRLCRPDVYSFTSVLGSCASVSGSYKLRKAAFHVAQNTFEEMCTFDSKGAAPNHVSYGQMLKACARLLPPGDERDQWVETYFNMCCKDGCVGEMVLSKLREATNPAKMKQLLNGMAKSELPPEWTWQVPNDEKKERRHRHSRKYSMYP